MDDPIPIVGISNAFVINFADSGDKHSITIENAPAFCISFASLSNLLASNFVASNCKMAIYVLEDNIIAPQNTIQVVNGQPMTFVDSNYIHNSVLRGSAGDLFGDPISFEDGKSLTEVNVSLPTSSSWNFSNCYPMAVIWKSDGSDYNFINLTR